MSKDKAGGARGLKVRVKTAGKRSLSSKLWLERQLNDPYVARAKREGFRSRAAFKLMEIDDKARFLKKGARVVDLGAAPGGWSQIAAKRVGAPAQGRVVAIDILEMDAVPGVDFALLDFLDPHAPEQLKAMLGDVSKAMRGVGGALFAIQLGQVVGQLSKEVEIGRVHV